MGIILFSEVDGDLAALPIAFLCLWLGITLPFRTVGRRNDLSYGLYVYGFPVQQTLALLGAARFGLTWFASLRLLLTMPLAIGSWFLVERPALQFKDGWRQLQRRVTSTA
jgi:peptidoglycan/LPS O-acetylase OafA/YrhL